ncbi:MAG TPA: AI-2E family transporter, partial [Flavihumibacter sp.]|nr:AI-2E family transporter [Flavihumibacter sp.]
ITFLSVQFASFSDLAPQLSKRSTEIFAELQSWAQNTFGLSLKKQSTMISELFEKSKEYIGSSLSTLASVLSTFILLPIYVFLILYYKPMFINFFYEVFDYVHGEQVSEVLTETKSAIQSYILGLLIEMLIVAALNATALLIIGVKYAILLGVVGAILNVIPYVGGLIAIALPVLISMVTKDPLNYTTPLVIIAAYIVIQFIDNNIIVPRVVSSKVEVNAFVSIVIVLLGGALWGISGMFLSIPFVAILKIIFDRVNELKPWGMLLGTKMNPDFSAKKSIDLDDIKEE